jgi:hypothetical protein
MTMVQFPAEAGIFLSATAFRSAMGPTQPPIQWVPWAISLGIKWWAREVDHPCPFNAEVKNAWSYTYAPSYVCMA